MLWGGPVASPSGSLKALRFKHSGTHDTYGPTLGNYSIECDFSHFPFWSEFACFWPYHYFNCCLATGTSDFLCWCSDYSSSDPIGILLLVFFCVLWAPLTAAINCCYILTQFNQGSCIEALVSWLPFPACLNNASLTTPNLEAYEVLCFSCSCSTSTFLGTHIRAM